MSFSYDLIVIGAGACGMMAAIKGASHGKKVLLLEQLPQVGMKLRATGGGRCNLTNTHDIEAFMYAFGKEGRFMQDALKAFDANALREFFTHIGVATHAPDGFRVFPTSHHATTILDALEHEIARLGITLLCNTYVCGLIVQDRRIRGVKCETKEYLAPNVVVATGGMGYPKLGASGDGYRFAQALGHTLSQLSPAMMPLHLKETWVAGCRADTLPKVTLRIALPKAKKLQATGDLIFTQNGIRGPVVLDFAREVTPFLADLDEVPLLAHLIHGMNEEQIRGHLASTHAQNPHMPLVSLVGTLLPHTVASAICGICGVDGYYHHLSGAQKDRLIKTLYQTPLTVIGHDGFKHAMITRGGIKLAEIDPKTMQSRLCAGLYFCGEVVNLDGPCGGYNLQWAFSSGYLAGCLGEFR